MPTEYTPRRSVKSERVEGTFTRDSVPKLQQINLNYSQKVNNTSTQYSRSVSTQQWCA